MAKIIQTTSDEQARKRLRQLADAASSGQKNLTGGKASEVAAKLTGNPALADPGGDFSAGAKLRQLADAARNEQKSNIYRAALAKLQEQTQRQHAQRASETPMRTISPVTPTSAEERLAMHRLDMLEQPEPQQSPMTMEELDSRKEQLQSQIRQTQERMQLTPIQIETVTGMVANPEYTALDDSLTGYMMQLSDLESERETLQRQLEQQAWSNSQTDVMAHYAAAAGGEDSLVGILDDYNTNFAMASQTTGAIGLEFAQRYGQARAQLLALGMSEEELRELAAYRKMQTNAADAEQLTQEIKQAASEHPVLASAASVPMALASGAGYLDAALQKGVGAITGSERPVDWNTPTITAATIANTIRQTVSEKIADDTEAEVLGVNIASFLYQTGMSMIDSASIAGLAAMGVPMASSLLGGSAAIAQAKDVISRGGSDAQALAGGLAAGVAETLFERVSLEQLLQTKAVGGNVAQKILGTLANVGKQSLTEGSEELFTSIANRISDGLIMGDLSQYDLAVNEYLAQGLNEGEAKRLASIDWGVELLTDFIGGAISGGVMGGIGSGVQAVRAGEQQTQTVDENDMGLYLEGDEQTDMQLQESPVEEDMGLYLKGNEPISRNAASIQTTTPGFTADPEDMLYLGEEAERVDQALRIGNATGRRIGFYHKAGTDSGIENGFYDKGSDTIYVNLRSENPVAQIIAHEMTHSVELADAYRDLQQLVFSRIRATGGSVEQLRANKIDLYARNGITLDEVGADKEVVAEFVEKNLLTDEKSITKMAQQSPTTMQIILNWLDKLLAKLGSKRSSEREFVRQAAELYRTALRQAQQVRNRQNSAQMYEDLQADYLDGLITEEELAAAQEMMLHDESLMDEGMLGRQYSIGETDDGRAVVVVDSDILSHIDITEWDKSKKAQAKSAAKAALLAFKDGIQVNGITYKVNKVSRDEFTRSNDTERLYREKPETFADKLRASANANDIIVATTSWANDGELTHPRTDNFVDFAHGEVLIQAGNNQYEAETVVGIKDAGEYVFYDVVDMEPTSFSIKKEPSTAATDIDAESAIQESSSKDSITENEPTVKKQFSISETDTAEVQQEGPAAQLKVETLPTKARKYLERAEKEMLDRISNALSIPYSVKRDFLKPIVREVSKEYLATGTVSQETLDTVFRQAYDNGIVVEHEFYDTYKGVKDVLRKTAVTIAQEDRAEIENYSDFRKSAFGRVNIVNQGGKPVGTFYAELRAMAPELFPANLVHPADQLQKMANVAKSIIRTEKSINEYYGPEAEVFRSWAKNDFETAVFDQLSALKDVKRYAEARAEQEQKLPQLGSQGEIMEAYAALKEARREYEKVSAKHLLTQSDTAKVGQLLRGDITLENLKPETDNIKGITAVYEAKAVYEKLVKPITEYNRHRKEALRKQADVLLESAINWEDKKRGILYSRETMERNIRDIVPERELADTIIDTYFTPVHTAQAAATRTKSQYRDRVRDLQLSRKVAKGNEVSEAYAVQLLGEVEDNIRMIKQSRGRLRERDGKRLEEWQSIVTDLWAMNPNLDQTKIRNAVQEFRKIYDELFEQMNTARVRNGYEPINYRNGYFPHFQAGEGDGLIAQFGKALGISTEVTALPTTINGLTHTFKPGIQWFSNAQSRLGFQTAYDAVEGFDKYIEGCADVIHQTDNIQRLRALATQIRYRTGDESLREQVDRVRADTTISDTDKQNRIDKIFEEGKYALSNFVVELDEYTNLLANKKSRADRNMEQALGREMYNLMKGLESRVAGNMVAINPASWLTNFIPLTQGGAMLDRGMLLKGMWQTLQAIKEDDGIVGKSTFLTNRRGSDPLVQTWSQAASATMSSPMEHIDNFTAGALVRARYEQNLKRGLSEDAAMSDADAWVAGVMADRSKGSTPTIFQRSNPLTKLFTQFQLEVNNQLSYLFKDMPRELKEKGLKALAAALIKFFLGAFLYNEVYEFFIGRRPALDPIGMLNDTVGDLIGYELPNLVDIGVGAVSGDLPSFRTEKVGAYEAVANLAGGIAEELPFVGGVLGGGRVPISSALPDAENLAKAVFNSDWSAEKRITTAAKELSNPLTYLALPFGGGQLKKAFQGIKAVAQGGSYTVDNEGYDILQYPVYNDSVEDIALGLAGSTLFGKSTLRTGREWVESGFDSLSAKETAVYQGLSDVGIRQEDAFALLQELGGVKDTKTESADTQKRHILQKSEISGEGKCVVYYGLLASASVRELMDALEDRGADMGDVTDMLIKIQDANLLEDGTATSVKREAIAASALTDVEKAIVAEAFLSAGETAYEKLSPTSLDEEEMYELVLDLSMLEPTEDRKTVTDQQRYEAIVDQPISDEEMIEALEAYMGADSTVYEQLRIATDGGVPPDTYIKFRGAAAGMTSDRDEDGEPISGSKREKVLKYIDGMNLTDSQKDALYYAAGYSERTIDDAPWH